jgi:hypothetical protein
VPVEPFPVLDVSGWDVIADETSGVEEKYWPQAPGSSTRWLFKTVTVKDGQVYGEDWAEKAVSELLPPSLFEHPAAELSVDDSAQLSEDRGQPDHVA